MSVKMRYYNESTLHVTSGIARQEQLEAALKAVFKQIRDHYTDEGYETAHFIANVITDTKGNIFGYAYVWVSDPRIYYMLVGMNPDGTERYEEYEDPNWVEPSEDRPETSIVGVNWADITEQEEELDEKYTRPMIRRQLPPLVRLPGYQYDEEQLKKAAELVKSSAGEEVPVPKLGYFEVSRSWVSNVDANLDETTLCCRMAPNWVTEEMIRPVFERYSTDTELRHGTVNGIKGMYSYPVVTFAKTKDKRTGEPCQRVFVAFSNLCPHDASFALLMTRKITIENLDDIRMNEKLLTENKQPRDVRKTLLVFSHWSNYTDQNRGSRPTAPTGPPTKVLPTVSLTTAPKVAPSAVARISGVTGRVTEWIQPKTAPPTSIQGIRTVSAPPRSTSSMQLTPTHPPVVSSFRSWGKPK
jgi:hypothetical protein